MSMAWTQELVHRIQSRGAQVNLSAVTAVLGLVDEPPLLSNAIMTLYVAYQYWPCRNW